MRPEGGTWGPSGCDRETDLRGARCSSILRSVPTLAYGMATLISNDYDHDPARKSVFLVPSDLYYLDPFTSWSTPPPMRSLRRIEAVLS